jgi:hypothetical protein
VTHEVQEHRPPTNTDNSEVNSILELSLERVIPFDMHLGLIILTACARYNSRAALNQHLFRFYSKEINNQDAICYLYLPCRNKALREVCLLRFVLTL